MLSVQYFFNTFAAKFRNFNSQFSNFNYKSGVFQSGQMGQTVNLLSFDFGGSNPSAPTLTPAKSGLNYSL